MDRKEAIEIVRDNWPEGRVLLKSALEVLIPELKESEDERVRKMLIGRMERLYEWATAKNAVQCIKDSADAIAWLEKQGKIAEHYEDKLDGCTCDSFDKGYRAVIENLDKQNPGSGEGGDKAETKFKAGDWVVYNKNIYQIHNISLKKYYECLRIDGTVHTFDFEYIDSKSHLWTIRDAKDGDVLATHLSPEGDFIGIYKESVDILGFKTYCFLNGVGEFVINPNRCRNHGTHGLHPATKEQCDLLFSKMKEAGYEWDDENKELKKIEQKLAWSEEDETVLDNLIYVLGNDRIGNYRYEYVDWLKSLKERMKNSEVCITHDYKIGE